MTIISPELNALLIRYQRNEITEHQIYNRLAKGISEPENRKVLERIASDELRHYQGWKEYTKKEVAPDRFKAFLYYWMSRVFGYTFGIKLMERGEENAGLNYSRLRGQIPEVESFMHDENTHEQELLSMLDEDLLHYAGSVVLGLNDALVELTGALSGLTLALQNAKLIVLSGAITGLAAGLSMAASEYLSTKSEEETGQAAKHKDPLKAAIFTGVAYLVTVVILILPYLFISNFYVCLFLVLVSALLIIALFNYYISVAQDVPFRPRFIEMAALSLGVAAISFLVGILARKFLGINV